ncbi:MAG: hypothetical protein HY553_16555 [Elusimicrobia bacterium]|nr:hypothetical protein [Elusimicrobiota bacterium]
MARWAPCLLGTLAVCSASLGAAAPVDCDRAPERALPLLKDRAMADGNEAVYTGAAGQIMPAGTIGKAVSFGDERETFLFSVLVKTAKGQRRRPRGYYLMHQWIDGGHRHRWMFRADLSGKLVDSASFKDTVVDVKEVRGSAPTEIYRRGPLDAVAREQFAKELRAACFIANERPQSWEQRAVTQEECACTCAFSYKKQRHVVRELRGVACGRCNEHCAPYVKEAIAEMKRSRKRAEP